MMAQSSQQQALPLGQQQQQSPQQQTVSPQQQTFQNTQQQKLQQQQKIQQQAQMSKQPMIQQQGQQLPGQQVRLLQQKTSMAGNMPGQGQIPQSQGGMGAFSTMGRNSTIPGPGVMTTASQGDINMANRTNMQGKMNPGMGIRQSTPRMTQEQEPLNTMATMASGSQLTGGIQSKPGMSGGQISQPGQSEIGMPPGAVGGAMARVSQGGGVNPQMVGGQVNPGMNNNSGMTSNPGMGNTNSSNTNTNAPLGNMPNMGNTSLDPSQGLPVSSQLNQPQMGGVPPGQPTPGTSTGLPDQAWPNQISNRTIIWKGADTNDDINKDTETKHGTSIDAASNSKVKITVELPDIEVHNRYKSLSQRLYEVLEVVGASNKMRQHWRRLSIYYEPARTVSRLPTYDCYIFGSNYEGTTTIGMNPDTDIVYINNDVEVVRILSEAPSGDCLLLIQDYSTPPGYCKLQLVHNGVPMSLGDKGWQRKIPYIKIRSDKRTNLVCSYDGLCKEKGCETHGPADRIGMTDNVFALKCFSWPDCAEEWLKRKRNHNWPPSYLIEVCSTLGFLLVFVGHPNSKERKLQCRLSFSHQERLLVEQFNSVQFKCYIVLKYIKLEMQENNTNELFLSSYHLKTAMFYLIENTPSDFWAPENLVSCVIAALKRILRCIETDNCPNYFIPDENMFEGKTDDRTRKILCNEIQQVISNDFEHFISKIQRDSLGQLMNSSPHSQIFQDKKTDGQETSLGLLCGCVLCCLGYRNHTIRKHYKRNIEEFISNLTQLQRTVRDKVSQEHDKEKQTAWPFCLSFIQVSLLSNSVALDIQEKRSKEEIWKSLTCDSWRELNMKIDSSKLKQASLMYKLGFYQDSLEKLSSLEHDSRFSVCRCRAISCRPKVKNLLKAGISLDLTPEEFTRDIVSPCVVFLPTESSVTPIAIRYEMIRSFGMPPESRDDERGDWYDWGVIDGRFLRHFLLYLNYSKLGSHELAEAAVHDMLNILKGKVSHRETCYNLLGWVYKLNEKIDMAIHQFKLSLEKQPTNNSANWHLCFLVRDLLGANPK